MVMDKELLVSAALSVEYQLLEYPGLGVPLDPEVAEFMGAFVEDAVSLDDLDDIEIKQQ